MTIPSPTIPAHLRLLTPAEYAARQLVTATARVFRTGPRIAPHRAAFEFYPTPPEATRALLAVEAFDGPIWEPACGEGHISKVLLAAGHQVVSTDLATCWDYGEGGRDFLRERAPLARHIVTNPPYGKGLADAFARHAIWMCRETGGKVAMLMNITGLCHPLRHAFYESQPPATVYCLDDCQCWPYGDPARATTAIGKQRYCWMVWRPDHHGPTTLRWLSTRAYRGP